MEDDEKEEARQRGSNFFKEMHAMVKWQPFTGDDTRTAAALLKKDYPNNPKWRESRNLSFTSIR